MRWSAACPGELAGLGSEWSLCLQERREPETGSPRAEAAEENSGDIRVQLSGQISRPRNLLYVSYKIFLYTITLLNTQLKDWKPHVPQPPHVTDNTRGTTGTLTLRLRSSITALTGEIRNTVVFGAPRQRVHPREEI